MTEAAIQEIFEESITIDEYLAREQVNRAWFARVRDGLESAVPDSASAVFLPTFGCSFSASLTVQIVCSTSR